MAQSTSEQQQQLSRRRGPLDHPTEELQKDGRAFNCETWQCDPIINILERRLQWNPLGVNEILQLLKIFDHRCVQYQCNIYIFYFYIIYSLHKTRYVLWMETCINFLSYVMSLMSLKNCSIFEYHIQYVNNM